MTPLARLPPGGVSLEAVAEIDALSRGQVEFTELTTVADRRQRRAAPADALCGRDRCPACTSDLTEAQAARLWGADSDVCRAVLRTLVERRFLVRTRGETFARA